VSAHRKLFGTDGIRGVANVEPMTSRTIQRLGMAVASRLESQGRKDRVVIGKDTRLSGYLFETALASGIVAMGGDVWITGPLPTPGIAFVTASMRADAGVVISASHNAYQDNGIKLFARDGFKLADHVEAEIEQLMASDDLDGKLAVADKIGYARRIEDAQGRYVVFCKHTFPREMTLDGIKMVVDCANGAAYKVAPQVFEELGAEVITIHDHPNGTNINVESGALHPGLMCERVVAEGANLGLALDGDADRAVMCDEYGKVVDGDAIMALCATRMAAAGTLKHNTVVATVMSNIGLERALRAGDTKLIRTDVGDRYVVEEMRRNGYNFGGEQSGHLVFLDVNTTGDGIVAGLRVLAAMVREGKPLSELAGVMERTPQVLVNVTVGRKRPLDELSDVKKMIAAVESKLGDDGRVLVRYSGTEPKARVMIEGPDEASILADAEEIARAIVAACA